ncbi:MAG: porin family protein [Spongiibacteraceae bacterium]
MNKLTRVSMFVASMLVSAIAFAGGATSPGFYAGGGFADTDVDIDGLNSDANVGVLFARGGYQVNQNVAVEARLGLITEDDKVNGVNVDLDNIYGLYLKAGLPTQIGLYPYVLLGMTHAKVEASWHGYTSSDSGSDISYGVGADYWFNSTVSAGIEFVNYYDKNEAEVSGLSVGLNFKF